MQKVFNFLKYGNKVIIVSFCMILSGFIYTFMYHGGYNWGIDFSSGVNINFVIDKSGIKDYDIQRILSSVYKTFDVNKIISSDESKSQFSIIVKSDITDYALKKEIHSTLIDKLNTEFGANVEILDSYFIDSNFSSILRTKSMLLVCLTFTLILFYVALRFRLSYAVASIFATIHDILFVVAFLGIFRIEINSSIIVSILTIIGYSLNDTIIIFDRIRENSRNMTDTLFLNILNVSIKQTLSRTILTSMTTFVAVLSIYVFTEGAIKDFSLIFMVGVVVGTYSSIFIASPILLSCYKKIK
ncbi:protein translocase subunit SecF [Borrelia turicatae]|uniref:Protein-export membrane protein SecF n=2 Tax=Borrelia turicatae TaxID=142 RepID=A0A172XC54_BORTU|nr:protein translocase subunit SecF [Borrelia turicatae]AAX17970.1 protein translocase subunit SecF [Borrelia turicatae 91E135]ANF34107.1 protein-export membrane protein SecF [Borrelia turicatae]UPA13476.1 protein translocase subunit SecF [Borrelia turicatae 91E135]UPA14959.1 protein translocase subunit SecF [Borrelia turicatae]